MLCHKCKSMKLDLTDASATATPQIHHHSYADLIAAVEAGCELCRIIHGDRPATFRGNDDYPDTNLYWDVSIKKEDDSQKAGHLRVLVSQRPNAQIAGLDACVDKGSPLADYILGRPIAEDSDSEICFIRVQEWHVECIEKHAETCPQFPDALLPTRVIDVGTLHGPYLPKLHISGEMETGSWVALSHCWGQKSNLVTNADNINQHVLCLPMGEMPATFQDAILTTRRLGYRFLWIDSLCIIQGCLKDWALESCQMQRYYKHAAITLASDNAKGDEDRFLGPRPKSLSSKIAIQCRINPVESDTVYLRDEIELEGTPSPTSGTLKSRAWVLQEDLLSPRTLHFGEEQMIWECQYHKIHECVAGPGSEDALLEYRINDITKRFFLKPESRHLHPGWSRLSLDWSNRWYNIVDNFTRRDISFHSDRLPAISAVAREFHDQTGWSYLAGLWREDFRRGLLWCDSTATINAWTPSWSWASLEYSSSTVYHGGVYHLWPIFDGTVLPHYQVDLSDWDIKLEDEDTYGRVKSGRLDLRGHWAPASSWKGCSTFHINTGRWAYGKSHSDVGVEDAVVDEIVCTFSTTSPATEMLHSGEISHLESGLSFLQISSWDLTKEPWPNAALAKRHARRIHNIEERSENERNYLITFGLVLVSTGTPGTFRRIGLCEIPRVNGLADNWEVKTISIV